MSCSGMTAMHGPGAFMPAQSGLRAIHSCPCDIAEGKVIVLIWTCRSELTMNSFSVNFNFGVIVEVGLEMKQGGK